MKSASTSAYSPVGRLRMLTKLGKFVDRMASAASSGVSHHMTCMALGGQSECARVASLRRSRGLKSALTLSLQVGPGPEFKGQCQHRLHQRVQAEILHKSRQIKVAEDLVGARLDGLGNLSRYRKVPRQFPHLGHEQVLIPGRVRYWPAEAGEDIGGIADDQPREVLCKDIHSVVIDKLWGGGTVSIGQEDTSATWAEAGWGTERGRGETQTERKREGKRGQAYFSKGFCLGVPLVRVVFVHLDGAQQQVDLGNGDFGEGAAGGAVGAGTDTRTQAAGVGGGMWGVGEAGVNGVLRGWVGRE